MISCLATPPWCISLLNGKRKEANVEVMLGPTRANTQSLKGSTKDNLGKVKVDIDTLPPLCCVFVLWSYNIRMHTTRCLVAIEI